VWTANATAFSPNGPIHLKTRQILLSYSRFGVLTTTGELLVLYDPSTNHYLWEAERRLPSDPSRLQILAGIDGNPHVALFSGADGISRWLAGGALFVRESAGTASSLDDAFDKAVTEVRELLGKKELPLSHVLDSKAIHFVEQRQRDFSSNPDWQSAAPNITVPRIESITRVDHGYRLRLRARWTGELTIGDDLTIKEPLHRVDEEK
jgi:hypothetical protein